MTHSRRIVVGMTSIPSRVALCRPALESLAEQERRPDLIVLSLPMRSARDDQPFDIPDWFDDAASPVPLRVTRPPVDWGPGTKLLGALPEIEDDDTLIVLDDDSAYLPRVIGHLADATASGNIAASFYTYRHNGLVIGQGADGFAIPATVARQCESLVPLVMEHKALRMHDDYWISFAVARAGLAIKSLNPLLKSMHSPTPYRQVHGIDGLVDLQGDLARQRVSDEASSILFRDASPTVLMQIARRTAMLRASLGRLRRAVGVGSST
jgi:hypothetical protein